MFQSVSHNLKTPINTIELLNDVIITETNLDEISLNKKIIKNNLTFLKAMINDILD